MTPEINILQFLTEQVPPVVQPHVEEVLVRENLRPLQVFNTGHSGCVVMKVENPQAEPLVLKLATDDNSQAEIEGNIRGFAQIRDEELHSLLPSPLTEGSVQGKLYLLEEFLGANFSEMTTMVEDPANLYSQVASLLDTIYTASRKKDGQAKPSLERIRDLLVSNYERHLLPAELISTDDLAQATTFDYQGLTTDISCFGVFDFTPEDIFLHKGELKYPDPKHEIRGNPIIDLACFAGVSRDVYGLAGAEAGYDTLHAFATTEVTGLLGLSSQQGETIFHLGRALQYSLSSRFRIGKEDELAAQYAQESSNYLRMCL